MTPPIDLLAIASEHLSKARDAVFAMQCSNMPTDCRERVTAMVAYHNAIARERLAQHAVHACHDLMLTIEGAEYQ